MDLQSKLLGSEGGGAGGGSGGGGGGDDGGKKDDGPPKPLPCPRCNSSNTKFCYYNNYSMKQPRFFCKGCRRYWTQGGTLRNVPVGGGCRKSKRPKMGPLSGSAAAQQPPPGFEFTATTVGSAVAGLTGVAGTGGSSSTNNNNNNFDNNNNNMVFGGVREGSDAGFFLPSLNFGPNMGLLHGFGLPNFHPNSNQLFQNLLYSTREIGSSSNSAPPVTGAWDLTMVPALPPPPLSEPNNINNNNNNSNNGDNNNNNDDNQSDQWAEYMGNGGIEEP